MNISQGPSSRPSPGRIGSAGLVCGSPSRRLPAIACRQCWNGKGRFLDKIFIERLWHTRKYECVYLHVWETGSATKAAIPNRRTFHNHQRPHSALGGKPPALAHWQKRISTNPISSVEQL
ncbi:integrase core domain-containing protein [Celeribacter neptunius]|uniref:integrase core domain-containing protein n=1 Tax=Celeribacter neptunius TaxID=588602 RepID=UPI003CCBE67A